MVKSTGTSVLVNEHVNMYVYDGHAKSYTCYTVCRILNVTSHYMSGVLSSNVPIATSFQAPKIHIRPFTFFV